MNPFSPTGTNIDGTHKGAHAVTPNDDADLPVPIRGVSFHGGNGTLAFVGWDGVTYQTDTLSHNGIYPVMIRRLLVTGTTVSQITGWI